MRKPVLVVTPHSSFGNMLRASLEETGKIRVFLAGDEPTALIHMKSEGCEIAFLDVDLGIEALFEIGRALRNMNSTVQLFILSDEELPLSLEALQPWTLIRKPFYLPELLDMIGIHPEPDLPLPPLPETFDLLWLQDANKAAQRLTRLTLESAAQAALITRGKKLWAYAGGLSQETANELAHIVSRNWDEQQGGDLLRFARLETTRAEHMLYATTLADEIVLALVFDAETPFSTIRTQANALARSLITEKNVPQPPIDPSPTSSPAPSSTPLDEPDEDGPSIAEILRDIPSPLPSPPADRSATAHPADPAPALPASILETRPSTPLPDAQVISRESSPPIPLKDLLGDETVKHTSQDLDVTAPSRLRSASPQREASDVDETRLHSITEVAGRSLVEPISPGLYHLSYACLLLPRFSSHYLVGDLADRLSEWVPNLCIAFGWRLEFIAVRPEYLQWIVSVPPNTSPGYLMRIMRQQTSERIFAEFPRLKKENPSGDFWAPGYLIMGGNQPHPPQLIKDYIRQTRQRQGDSQPHKT